VKIQKNIEKDTLLLVMDLMGLTQHPKVDTFKTPFHTYSIQNAPPSASSYLLFQSHLTASVLLCIKNMHRTARTPLSVAAVSSSVGQNLLWFQSTLYPMASSVLSQGM